MLNHSWQDYAKYPPISRTTHVLQRIVTAEPHLPNTGTLFFVLRWPHWNNWIGRPHWAGLHKQSWNLLPSIETCMRPDFTSIPETTINAGTLCMRFDFWWTR